jgi:hypothetical protein
LHDLVRLAAVMTTHPSFGKIAGAISPKSTFPQQGRLGRECIRHSPPLTEPSSIPYPHAQFPVSHAQTMSQICKIRAILQKISNFFEFFSITSCKIRNFHV